MRKVKKRRLTVDLTLEQYKEVERRAKKQDKNLVDIIREAIEKLMQEGV